MPLQRLRRAILCRCADCHQGRTYTDGKQVPCKVCNGSGEVERWIVETIHADASPAADGRGEGT